MTRTPRLFALLALASACTNFRAEFSGGNVGTGETVLVGRVELVPPLRPEEQSIAGISPIELKNRVFLLLDDHPRVIRGEPTNADYNGAISAPLGGTFAVRVPAQPIYVLGASIPLKTGPVAESAYLPGGLRVDIQSGDRGAYMGTVRYYRNEFFDVVRVELVDEQDHAEEELRARVGTLPALQKRLATVLTPQS